MTEWQSSLARGLAALESRFDALRLAFKSRFGTNRLPMIQPYIGHATTDAVFLRGRVLFNKNITPSTVTDSLWTNLKNTYKRFESDEIPFAKVRVSVDNLSQEVICDEEGFFKVVLHPEERLTPDDYWQNVQLQVIETPIPGLPLETAAAVGRVIVPPPDAQFAVVSDLDDTIVRTEVLKPLRDRKSVV
jgi:phosphatidate phosphatase APP1